MNYFWKAGMLLMTLIAGATSSHAERQATDTVQLEFTRPGWDTGADSGHAFIPLGKAALLSPEDARARFALKDWFAQPNLTVHGIPFQLGENQAIAVTTIGEAEDTIDVALSARGSELYLLTLARFEGLEEHVYKDSYYTPDKALDELPNIDRVRVDLRYADGGTASALPARVGGEDWGIGAGLGVLTVRVDPARELAGVSLYKGTRQAELGLLALTLKTDAERRFDARWTPRQMPVVKPVSTSTSPAEPTAVLADNRLTLRNAHLEAEFDLTRQATPLRLLHRALGTDVLGAAVLPVFGVRAGGEELPADVLKLVEARPIASRAGYLLTYASEQPALEATLELSIDASPAIFTRLTLRNSGETSLTLEPVGPRLAPVALGAPVSLWYFYPGSETILSDATEEHAKWYGGSIFPHQFLTTYRPELGGGVGLLVKDLLNIDKQYVLAKDAAGVAMQVAYQPRALQPMELYRTAPAELQFHVGDWRTAVAKYMAWVETWHKPLAPRPQWWREVFNFRQGFMHIDYFGTMLDPETKDYRFKEYMDETREVFGGVDYLHVFDWGLAGPHGRTYHRVGDQDPAEHYAEGFFFPPGGWPAFQQAVNGVRDQGVRVGYYIEGFLLNENSRLGQRYGEQWAARDSEGTAIRWPGSPELAIDAGIQPWRDIQSETFARIVERMDADGMYIDQFGYNGPARWNYAGPAGQPVPSHALADEAEMTREIRLAMNAVKPEAVLYTEYTPTDVISQYQEGAFSYSMQRQKRTSSVAPLKLFRYAFPTFKNIELLYCDSPTGTWATGARWAFWNGEGIWIQGKAREWFGPQTQRAIREGYKVLHAYRDAFAGESAEMLVPTLADDVYANRFDGPSHTVYTFYNARRETYAGDVIALPLGEGTHVIDPFSGKTLTSRNADGQAVFALQLDPLGVGCIVIENAGN